MAQIIIMPKLGFNMDEGELVCWHKKVGDTVKKGELFFEINTDKTTMPIEATEDGVLLKILVRENETVEVFTPIAVIGEAGENPDTALAQGGQSTAEVSPNEQSNAEKVSVKQGTIEAIDAKDMKLTPKAKKLIKDEAIDLESVRAIKGTGYQGGITAKDIKASPLARKIAEKKNIDLTAVAGSGVHGKVMKIDVETVDAKVSPAASEDKKILSAAPYKGVRKIIGDKLAESKFTAPHLYFTDAVDTTNMTNFRKEMNQVSERKITVSDLLVYAASKALQKYPQVNSSLVNGEIICYKSTNVGVAVAGDNGLIVPVIKNVQEKTLTTVSTENRDLVDRAKAGRLKPQEYSGGTFSISNLGMFGIDNFTAIINPPEAAILSVSSVKKTPVVIEEDGEDHIVIRPMMNIQLSVDHRIIDGLLAAQFVGYMKELLENSLKILM